MICPACGCKEIEKGDHRCPRCGRRLDRPAPDPVPLLPLAPQASAAAARAPEWKQELAERVERFQHKRARQQGLFEQPFEEEKPEAVPGPDPAQKVVGFEDFAAHRIEPVIVDPPARPLAAAPRRVSHTIEEPAPRLPPPAAGNSPRQSALLPPLEAPRREDVFLREIVCPYPVAPLVLRCLAGLLDAAVGVVALGVFGGTFDLLGGALPLNNKALGAMGAAAACVMAFYLFVYTCYGPETPGLQWMRLSILDYDGNPPQPGQRLVRAAGVLLSAAALGLGYLWALVDEEGLTWHDRMSRTFVTRDAGRS